MWMFLFLLLPVAALVYVGWHIWQLLPLTPLWRGTIVALLVACFLTEFLNFGRIIDRMPLPLARLSYDIGNSSLIVLLYLVMIFLLLDVLRLLHIVPEAWLHNNFAMSACIATTLFWLFIAANWHYRQKTREAFTLTTNKPLARPLKLVMASDLHLGYHNPRHELARWVDMINGEQPDYVLIAGDIIDMSIRPLIEERMAEEFRRIKAPIIACLGNHEYYSGEPRARQFYIDAGIRLLRDTVAIVGDLCIVGRDDRTNPRRRPLRHIVANAPCRERFSILLDHQPYHLEQAEQCGFDLQLSGHTHHGQVWPISWITDRIYECAFGHHQRGNTHYYISSGLGIWGGKFRIGTRSEYVVIEVNPST